MNGFRLEYRIAQAHVGPGRIEAPGMRTHTHNPFWSYARHLPGDWDTHKIVQRTNVAKRLSNNLLRVRKGMQMDLTPLKNDQRAAGIVFGENPLQNMFNLIEQYTGKYPKHSFFGKWGGRKPAKPGKRFVFYVEDEQDAALIITRMRKLASQMHVRLDIAHQYGLTAYQRFVKIDEQLRSVVRDVESFKTLLQRLVHYPHFLHHLFLE